MDLRVRKTKKAIKEAFLYLRNNNALEKIKVKDICEISMINKTTFYKHYEDVYALSNELEKQAISQVMDAFVTKNEIFNNPVLFLKGLPDALNTNREILYRLFHDNFDKLFVFLEKEIKQCYIVSEMTEQEYILLTFAIGGALHTMRILKFERNCDDDLLAGRIAEIMEKIRET
ncbi:MAG: hypothetical protein IKY30_00170 [Oscillospiraceae bacterium]|nr:hypothetical protein [Oscillospiraceae bacterium]